MAAAVRCKLPEFKQQRCMAIAGPKQALIHVKYLECELSFDSFRE